MTLNKTAAKWWAVGPLALALACLSAQGAAWAEEREKPASEVQLSQPAPQAASAEDEPAYVFDWEISRFLEEGIAYHREGELDGAVTLYERCRRCDPRRIEVLPYLALALDQQGKYEESLALYGEYLRQEPEDDLVRFNSAAAHVHAGKYAQALELIEPLLDRYQLEPLYTLAGVAHFHLDNKEQALAFLKKAIELQPENGLAYSNLGSAYIAWGDLQSARESLIAALQLAPAEGAVLNNVGVVLEARGKREPAALAFREAAKRGVKSAEINELALRCALGQADTMAAAQCADKYPQMGQARLLYVWALLADDRPQEAADELERWQKEHEADIESCVYLGSIYFRMGRYEEALRQYQTVLSRRDTPEMHYNASLCLSRLGRSAEAEREARRAYEMSPQRPEIICNLARCSEALGGRDEARSLYKRLGAEFPDFIDADRLEEHLRRL